MSPSMQVQKKKRNEANACTGTRTGRWGSDASTWHQYIDMAWRGREGGNGRGRDETQLDSGYEAKQHARAAPKRAIFDA